MTFMLKLQSVKNGVFETINKFFDDETSAKTAANAADADVSKVYDVDGNLIHSTETKEDKKEEELEKKETEIEDKINKLEEELTKVKSEETTKVDIPVDVSVVINGVDTPVTDKKTKSVKKS